MGKGRFVVVTIENGAVEEEKGNLIPHSKWHDPVHYLAIANNYER